ncbi:MAG: RluA family pseudouridine synthase [Myxococcales bacterium]|nr:RluA family pseudouridine synthase [Myxococcales bacterium]MCB9643632.1 RluA family pseudouridine synthase [Myxococcales bacterium]
MSTSSTPPSPNENETFDEDTDLSEDEGSSASVAEHTLKVTVEQTSQRLDRYLASLESLPYSRSQLKRWIQEGHIYRNDRSGRPADRVQAGDIIRITPPPPEPITAIPQDIPLDIFYEDEHLIVINKPVGMVVHPAPGHPSGTLVNALLFHCRDLSGIGDALRPGIVHRLDRDTSGVLVVAKHDQAHRGLADLFRLRPKEHLDRRYLAIARGTFNEDKLHIDTPYGRHPTQRLRFSSLVQSERRAVTDLWVQERFTQATLLMLRLHTGRTHQIRVHLADRGRPLIGDALYGGNAPRNWPHALRDFPRQALHAARLAFTHPITQEFLSFEAPLPEDLQQLLQVLRALP